MNRWNNDRGMALLISIVILFLLSSVLFHLLTVLESERRFLQLEVDWNTLDQQLVSGTEEVINLINEYGNLASGRLDFFNGSVHYQVITERDVIKIVTLKAYTNSGRYRGARFHYHTETGTIFNWVEGANIQ